MRPISSHHAATWIALVVLGLLCAPGCGESPAASPADRAAACLGRSDYAQAIVEADEALRIDPTNVDAYQVRGKAHLYRAEPGDLAASIADFTNAIRLAPTEPEAYYLRAIAYRDHGDADRSEADRYLARSLDGKLASDLARLPSELDEDAADVKDTTDDTVDPQRKVAPVTPGLDPLLNPARRGARGPGEPTARTPTAGMFDDLSGSSFGDGRDATRPSGGGILPVSPAMPAMDPPLDLSGGAAARNQAEPAAAGPFGPAKSADLPTSPERGGGATPARTATADGARKSGAPAGAAPHSAGGAPLSGAQQIGSQLPSNPFAEPRYNPTQPVPAPAPVGGVPNIGVGPRGGVPGPTRSPFQEGAPKPTGAQPAPFFPGLQQQPAAPNPIPPQPFGPSGGFPY